MKNGVIAISGKELRAVMLGFKYRPHSSRGCLKCGHSAPHDCNGQDVCAECLYRATRLNDLCFEKFRVYYEMAACIARLRRKSHKRNVGELKKPS